MSKTLVQWLYRLGIGLAGALVPFVTEYLQNAETASLGPMEFLGGALLAAAAWALGKLGQKIPTVPE